MNRIPIQPVANQSLRLNLSGNRYDVAIKEAGGIMSVSISIDDEVVISGSRLLPNTPIIPFRHLENGNYLMISDGDEIPYYTEFGSSQRLVFMSQAEIEALRAAN